MFMMYLSLITKCYSKPNCQHKVILKRPFGLCLQFWSTFFCMLAAANVIREWYVQGFPLDIKAFQKCFQVYHIEMKKNSWVIWIISFHDFFGLRLQNIFENVSVCYGTPCGKWFIEKGTTCYTTLHLLAEFSWVKRVKKIHKLIFDLKL